MSSEMSPLFRLAIASGKAETVRSHLERGADPNARDNSGATALLLAASRGRQHICEILIDHGADPFATDGAGRTVRDYATQWGLDLPIHNAAPLPVPPKPSATGNEARIVSTLSGAEDAYPYVDFSTDPAPHRLIKNLSKVPGTADGASAEENVEQTTDGWEAEPEFRARPADDVRVSAAEAAHEAFSRASAAIDTSDWSQVTASLPPVLAPTLPELPKSLRDVIVDALRHGRVTAAKLRECFGRTKSVRLYSRPIRILLSDLGVVVDTTSLGEILDAEAPPAPSDEVDADAVKEALDFLVSLLGEDPEAAHLGSMRSLREDAVGLQPILWARTEELRRRLAHVFARMPGGLELLEEVGALFPADEGNDPQEDRESEEDLAKDEDALLLEGPDGEHPSYEEDHLASRFAGLTHVELAQQLTEMRLRPKVFEDAARRAREVQAEGFEDALAFATELRRRLNRIVETNLSLVAWVARRYRNKGMEPLDLIQEGSIGLMKAVEKYDPDRGAALGTYATWWIRQSITRAMADLCRTIRVPVHLQERARKLEKVRQELHGELGRPATSPELAEEMDISLDALVRLQRLTGTLVTRGNNVERLTMEMATGLVDPQANPEDAMWEGSVRQEIALQLLELTPREERVVRLRFGIGMADELTLEQVGETFEVTRERIRQIEAKALRRLSHPSRAKRLKGALDVR